ncbi:Hpt domain-containing protein [Leptolyngbya sp. FACHB-36]|uniref:Hpt domain-containing protein n=1 Tax=Leptolyngbya sp. FACHB-36 TaxID=2692808 RepID=UPI001680A539|nr:Hpt domain-containing protein [Leptolyngbya sp. FACHB-36]
MQATKQQQIVVYFIEEAKEHLDTIEQGLLSLAATMADAERLNELFRAAHSVKGGAAMLGFNGIQKVGHHLEDCFKLLKDHSVPVDRPLEDLFLQVFDVLKALIEELQSPYGFQEQVAEKAVRSAEPKFVELEHYLNHLIRNIAGASPSISASQSSAASPDTTARIYAVLKRLLQLFKQGDTPANRQQSATLCARIRQLHPSSEWQGLTQVAQTAIANPKNSYQTLAPLVIKELKQATDLIAVGRASEIIPSQSLQRLGAAPIASVAQSVASTPAAVVPSSRQSVSTSSITIPAEPRAAAKVLLTTFDKQQLIELAEFLMKAIQ